MTLIVVNKNGELLRRCSRCFLDIIELGKEPVGPAIKAKVMTKDELMQSAWDYVKICEESLLLDRSIEPPKVVHDEVSRLMAAFATFAPQIPAGFGMTSRLLVHYLFPNLTLEERTLLEDVHTYRDFIEPTEATKKRYVSSVQR